MIPQETLPLYSGAVKNPKSGNRISSHDVNQTNINHKFRYNRKLNKCPSRYRFNKKNITFHDKALIIYCALLLNNSICRYYYALLSACKTSFQKNDFIKENDSDLNFHLIF